MEQGWETGKAIEKKNHWTIVLHKVSFSMFVHIGGWDHKVFQSLTKKAPTFIKMDDLIILAVIDEG